VQQRPVPVIDAALLDALAKRDWPGNVRELRNTLERLVAYGRADGLEVDLSASESGAAPPSQTIEAMEQQMILAAIAAHGGSPARAAKALGISRATIYRRLDGYRTKRGDHR
jgi:two-component system C4-dicarboxylate transport response regulator DctD